VKGANVPNVIVTLQPGREKTYASVLSGRIRVIMSDGAKRDLKMAFSDNKIQAHKEIKSKYDEEPKERAERGHIKQKSV
jgi:hypothetical protein